MRTALRPIPAGLFVVSLSLVTFAAGVRADDPADAKTPDLDAVKTRIVDATNKFREGEGRRRLEVNRELATTAQDFADFMARTDKYGHTADGKEPWERATAHGYKYCIVLENIAWQLNSEGFTTAELGDDFMTGWKESPPHRKNLLDPDTYDIGVGVAHSAKTGRYYAVQNFGRPRSKAITFKVVNETGTTIEYKLDGKPQTLKPRYIMTHEHCRPPELSFEGDGEAKPAEKGQVFHPQNGSEFIIRKARGGKLSVSEKGGEDSK